MSGAGGIETAQLNPLDNNPAERHRAAIACADYTLRHSLGDISLLELLRELGLTHDPHALDRDPLYSSKISPEQR